MDPIQENHNLEVIYLGGNLLVKANCLGDKQGCTSCASLPAWLWENGERMRKWRVHGERMRKWRENEEMERDLLATFPHFLLISSLYIYFQKKNWTYALWDNNYGSNSLWEISASCEGLETRSLFLFFDIFIATIPNIQKIGRSRCKVKTQDLLSPASELTRPSQRVLQIPMSSNHLQSWMALRALSA